MGIFTRKPEPEPRPSDLNPAVVCESIEKSLRTLLATKLRTGGIKITGPNDDSIEEISRYLTEGLLKMDDPRHWRMFSSRDLRVGDVFTYYQIIGSAPVAEDVSILSLSPHVGKVVIKFVRPGGEHATIESTEDFAWWIYRPTKDELRMEMEAL